jgi:hypothetical protein
LDVESASVNISQLPADTQALLPQAVLPNLQTLDLCGNNLTSVNMTCMLFLPNLRVLRLADNPLTSLWLGTVTVVRRLITVAVTDFLCWFPIGLCGLLSWTGWRIPGEVTVAMAMLVLPINAALNPFLYTFNVIVEKRRKAGMQRLMERLKADMLDM